MAGDDPKVVVKVTITPMYSVTGQSSVSSGYIETIYIRK